MEFDKDQRTSRRIIKENGKCIDANQVFAVLGLSADIESAIFDARVETLMDASTYTEEEASEIVSTMLKNSERE